MSPMPHFETDANNLYFLATIPIHPAFIDERAFLASIGKDLDEAIRETDKVIGKNDEVIRKTTQVCQKTDEVIRETAQVSQEKVLLLQKILLLAQRAYELSDKMSIELFEAILDQINKNKSITIPELAKHCSASVPTINRYLSHLMEHGFISHQGPNKGGYRTINWEKIG